MRKKILSLALALVMCLGLTIPTVAAAGTPAVSNNQDSAHRQNGYYAKPIQSYLYTNDQGGLTRVEYIKGQLIAEEYDASFKLLTQRSIELELPIWGGFFAGENYNFIITGQKNPQEDDQKEVIRVVKYSKDWRRLGQTNIYGFNTYIPFDAGVVRCAEYGDMLYVFTCYEMYHDQEGLHHQNNLFFSIQQSTMKLTFDTTYQANGHSFNQFIIVDNQNNVVRMDAKDLEGDMIHIYMTLGKAGLLDPEAHGLDEQAFISFQTNTGAGNATGVYVDGFAETSEGYLTAYSYQALYTPGSARNIYLAFTDKSAITSTDKGSLRQGAGTTIRQLTNLEGNTISAPKLVPNGLESGYIMWNNTVGYAGAHLGNTLYYAVYRADGTIGEIHTAEAGLSDCQPILYNGKVVWYATNDSAPTFYTLDSTGVTAHETGAGSQPTTPDQPQQPSGTATASPTNDKLEVNGNAADPTVYKINGSNYFKIRDVAALLNGTEKQFAVGYDGSKNAVTATTGQGYDKQSGDLAGAAKGGDQAAAASNDAIYVDGEKITAEVYKINGSNYFKLRDLGKALDFYVGWSAQRGMYIETDKPYTE